MARNARPHARNRYVEMQATAPCESRQQAILFERALRELPLEHAYTTEDAKPLLGLCIELTTLGAEAFALVMQGFHGN